MRLVIDIAIRNKWLIQQLDVNNAFLQGTVTNEVYIEQPHGFIDSDKHDHVFHLHKAIYGLNKAPRAWYPQNQNVYPQLGLLQLPHIHVIICLSERKSVCLPTNRCWWYFGNMKLKIRHSNHTRSPIWKILTQKILTTSLYLKLIKQMMVSISRSANIYLIFCTNITWWMPSQS